MTTYRSLAILKWALVLVLSFAGFLSAGTPPPPASTLYSAPTTIFPDDQVAPHLWIVNPQTALSVPPELSLQLINGDPDERICYLRGLAAHPTTGKLYSMLDLGYYDSEFDETDCDFFPSNLVEIDPATGNTNIIGNTFEPYAALAFDNGGNLYGVQGNQSVSGQLDFIDITDATTAFVDQLSGFQGHSLAFNPNDGLLYHATRNGGTTILETYNLITSTLTPVSLPGATPLNSGNPLAMTWDQNGNQLLYTLDDFSNTLYEVTTGGSESFVGGMDHTSKGLAFTSGGSSGHFIPDVNLRLLVQNELGLPGEPTQGDMVNLFHLWERFAGGPESSKVTNLTGLEFATNLVNLDLSDHNVSDLAPLAGLTSLNGLYMSDNNISSIAPLSSLNLQFLYITFNSNISSISAVSSMSNLRYLGCGWCSITSVTPVSGMTQLIELQIDYNPISDITPIYGLPNLTRLGLGGLGLNDIAFLSTWPNMVYLALSSNSLTDLSSLSQFTSLTSLYFYSMTITDISFLNSLTNLERMGFAFNNVSDISPIASLTALKSLFAYNNQFSNIAPLTGLTNLQSCLIYNNPLNPLAYCSHAATIQANNPSLTNFNFGTNTNPLSSDCTTDPVDLAVVTGYWGRTDCTDVNNWCDGADLNMDGKVDLIDFVFLNMIWLAIP